jgi:hypothetical protein
MRHLTSAYFVCGGFLFLGLVSPFTRWHGTATAVPSSEQMGLNKMLERFEKLWDRLYHLGYLGEELESIESSGGRQGWLYGEIAREAAAVAASPFARGRATR